MKNIFLEAGNRGAIYPVAIPDPTDEATGKQAMTAIRKAALDLTFMSDKYNYMGVTTHTPIGEQYIFQSCGNRRRRSSCICFQHG